MHASIRINDEDGDSVAQFEISEENSFVEFTQKLPNVKDIALTARGKGCFLVQVSDKNVDSALLNSIPVSIIVLTIGLILH